MGFLAVMCSLDSLLGSLRGYLVSLNLLAFAMHSVRDIGDELRRNARVKLGPHYSFFSKLAAITIYLIFPSCDDLLLTLAFVKPPPIPPRVSLTTTTPCVPFMIRPMLLPTDEKSI